MTINKETDDTNLLESSEAGTYGAVNADAETPIDANLYLYQERFADSPRLATLLQSISSYNASIPKMQSADQAAATHVPAKANLGTFFGVYLPCIQNILGIIFFIRMVWIVGTAGIVQSYLIVLLCCAVTFATCISLSAIATNGIVPSGGSYFMISRSLGPEFGGAVGILFYLANTFAGAMYLTGAIEIFLMYMAPKMSLFGDFHTDPVVFSNNIRTYGTLLLAVVGTMVLIGVKFVSKFAPFALLCVLLSILSVYIGVFANLHGKSDVEICILGERLLKKNYEVCSKDPHLNGSLYHIFCKQNPNNASDVMCDKYFETHEAKTVLAIPGLTSNIFKENLHSWYREATDFLASSANREMDTSFGDETYDEVLVDISTSFTLLLGIFFSSCTDTTADAGILAGSNRSGDLEDAQRSIPTGTIAAQVTTSVIYYKWFHSLLRLTTEINFCHYKACVPRYGESTGGRLAVALLSWPHPMVVIVGSFLSTFGAALQSLIGPYLPSHPLWPWFSPPHLQIYQVSRCGHDAGAPRLLHAIALDHLIPFLKPFKVTNSRNEPTRALLATLLLCEFGILIGNLDLLAPVLTMFFLMSYMFVNLACTLQSLLQTPNWRPRFHYYHWSLSLLGVFLCLLVMFLISWFYALFSMLLAGVIYKYIEFRGAEKEWGDGIHGLALSAARYSLLKLEEGPPHTKNWRPQLLVFCKLGPSLEPLHPQLFDFASQLKAGHGLTLVCSVLEGEYGKMYSESQAARQSLKRLMDEKKVKGFTDVVVAKDVSQGICYLIQTAGLGGMKHNTVLVGWPYGWKHSHDPRSYKVFFDSVKDVSSSKNALLVIKGISSFPDNNAKLEGTIDIWWILHEGGLLLLLPFLLKQHRVWKNCKLRIFTLAHILCCHWLLAQLLELLLGPSIHIVGAVPIPSHRAVFYLPPDEDKLEYRNSLALFLYQLRIEASIEIVDMPTEDMTDYIYERARIMEQRREFLKQMHTSYLQHKPTLANQFMGHSGPKACVMETHEEFPEEPLRPREAADLSNITPDESNVLRMNTAIRLNEVIVQQSHNAQLVILNLPGFPDTQNAEANCILIVLMEAFPRGATLPYMEFLEVLTEGLERVLMVRGGGREVITIYS
ncbi:hypothetical protein LAZ67_16000051 [Cordylochernes scorpioides]|uniref:Solute carrier family 12 member 4 n=1 Tax=Cordylochernes scorpioides TaxID=51811 RepID=A0ABY6LAA9_9ARAC|nr:hypothetical protein LAZ67_16000051 [Cordylochernes scorpioides]